MSVIMKEGDGRRRGPGGGCDTHTSYNLLISRIIGRFEIWTSLDLGSLNINTGPINEYVFSPNFGYIDLHSTSVQFGSLAMT